MKASIPLIFYGFHYWEIERTRQVADQEDKIILRKNVLDAKNQESKWWSCLGQTISRPLIVFLSQLVSFCTISPVVSEEFIVQKLVFDQLFGWEFRVKELDAFIFTKTINKLVSTKKPVSLSFGWSIRDGKVTIYQQKAQSWIFLTKIWQNSLFVSTLPATLRCHAKWNW